MNLKTNKLRTPSGSPRNSKINFHKKNDDNTDTYNISDKCRVHLAECYEAKKRIDLLTGELQEKNIAEEISKKKLEEEEKNTQRIESLYLKEVQIKS